MVLRVPKSELPTGLRESMIKQLGAVPEPSRCCGTSPASPTLACTSAAK
jgi:hypothetical protein